MFLGGQFTFLIGLFNLHIFFPMPIKDWEGTAHFDSFYGTKKKTFHGKMEGMEKKQWGLGDISGVLLNIFLYLV